MPFKLRVAHKVDEFIATLTEEERGDFVHCLELIAADPHIDGRYKITLPIMQPCVPSVYYSGTFSILYHLVSSDTIHVFQAKRGPCLPPPSDFRRR